MKSLRRWSEKEKGREVRERWRKIEKNICSIIIYYGYEDKYTIG